MQVQATSTPVTLIDAVWPHRRLIHNAALVIGFSLIIALSAQVAIPLPFSPVPPFQHIIEYNYFNGCAAPIGTSGNQRGGCIQFGTASRHSSAWVRHNIFDLPTQTSAQYQHRIWFGQRIYDLDFANNTVYRGTFRAEQSAPGWAGVGYSGQYFPRNVHPGRGCRH
ncbi:MAG: hypothetical protein HC822_22785 [Oscillochloris sp.]|nr:hypothetical protein [Oscillochloris sp.]